MAEAAKLNREAAGNAGESNSGTGLGQVVKNFADWFLGLFTRLRQFFHDVRTEMRQVNWPSRQDVISTTIVVVVTVAFFGIYFFITDSVFLRLYEYVHKHLTL
jgi:preprotein translocase subunit SecE